MMRSDLSNLATRCLFGPAQPKQRTDLVERKPQLARTPNEHEDAKVGRVVDTAAAARARWRRKQFNPLVVANRLNIDTATVRQLSNRQRLGSRRRDGTHEIVLDPVVATGCTLQP